MPGNVLPAPVPPVLAPPRRARAYSRYRARCRVKMGRNLGSCRECALPGQHCAPRTCSPGKSMPGTLEKGAERRVRPGAVVFPLVAPPPRST